MDNPVAPSPTTPGIIGYRNLTQAEKDLMNEIKTVANQVKEIVDKVERAQMETYLNLLSSGLKGEAVNKAMNDNTESHRWRTMARDDLQLGFMELTRSVALPTSF